MRAKSNSFILSLKKTQYAVIFFLKIHRVVVKNDILRRFTSHVSLVNVLYFSVLKLLRIRNMYHKFE